MKSDIEKTNKGKIIRQKITEKGISVKDFAKMIHQSVSNTYSLFKRDNFNSELLEKMSKIIDYDLNHCMTNDDIHLDCIVMIKINKDKLNQLLEEDKSINLIGLTELF